MISQVWLCDACGLPIADDQRQETRQLSPREVAMLSSLGMISMIPRPPSGIHLTGDMHPHCRAELEAAVADLASAMRDRALSDIAALRAAFET